jgi:cell division protein FtsB
MVSRPQIRKFFGTLALYTAAAFVILYFGRNAYTGDHGLIAKQDLDQEIGALTGELNSAKAERAVWERRVSLLRPNNLDPDLLDERARQLLDWVDPHDVTLVLKRTDGPKAH